MAVVPTASAKPGKNLTAGPETDEKSVSMAKAITIADGYGLQFSNADFQSTSIHYFNSGNTIPAGTYILNVTGWNSPWSSDHGWWEEGATNVAFKAAAWRELTNLRVEGNTTRLLTIINGTFNRENSTGTTVFTLITPSHVGILITDSTYYDNRGSATFVLKNVTLPVADFTGQPY
jgi:hypothetical protein